MSHTPARTRFAPSPTGSLHVGGARTALYCLLWARVTGGKYILRIEDTDRRRSTEESTNGILADLAWLGLDWDEGPGVGGDVGPYFQSERLDLYNPYVEQLLASGHAYEAWETSEELTAMRLAAQKEKRTFRYRRPELSDAQVQAYRDEGRTPVVRLVAPAHDVTVSDRVLGEVTVVTQELDDIVIRKADGFPTYHFAVVVDDHLMGVDLILRGQEHLMNTHKHAGAFEALDWSPVETGHLPLIFNPTGSKMSKRDKAKAARAGARLMGKAMGPGWDWLSERTGIDEAELGRFMKKKNDGVQMAQAIAAATDTELPMIEVIDFRKAGYVPEALNNYLALLGWSPGDDRQILSMDELIAAFDISRITKTPARFDPDKLRWVNGEYLRGLLDDAQVMHRMDQWLEVVDSPLANLSPERRLELFQMYRQRVHTFGEFERAASYFFAAPTAYDAKAVKKHITKGGGAERLPLIHNALADVGRWEVDSLEAALNQLVETTGAKLGKFAQPIRIAVSGAAVTPSIYEVLAYLGRDETLARLKACEAHFAAPSEQ